MLIPLLQIVDLLLQVLLWIIIIQAVLSWLVAFNVVSRYNSTVGGLINGLDRLTDPLYRPIRRILPDFGAIDLSPMIVLLLIQIARSIVIPAIARAAIGG